MEMTDTTNSAYDLLPEAERKILLRIWPRYEDGELVNIADELEHGMVDEISFLPVGWYITCTNGTICEPYGTRVKRPTVLAADGKPLEVGQTVWTVDAGIKFEVHSIEGDTVWGSLDGDRTDDGLDPKSLTHQRPVLDAEGNLIEPAMDVWWICDGDERGIHAEKLHVESIGDDGIVTCSPFNSGTWVELESSELYVNRPVLDADGVPIHEGDTVYLLPGGYCGDYPLYYYRGGDEMVVKKLDPDHELEGVLKCAGDGKCSCFPLPSQLTHTKPEPPDSWEKVWSDVYQGRTGSREMACRCKRLAERGE